MSEYKLPHQLSGEQQLTLMSSLLDPPALRNRSNPPPLSARPRPRSPAAGIALARPSPALSRLAILRLRARVDTLIARRLWAGLVFDILAAVRPIFDGFRGGDPLLFQHLFWFYSHPAVYIMILPAMGVVTEVVTCFARRRVFGYATMVYAILAIAIIGFAVWGHHMFVSGQSVFANLVFSFLSFIVAVPSAIKVFGFVTTTMVCFHSMGKDGA